MKILVAGIPSSPFEHDYKIHYSIFKSFGAATGFADLGHEVYFMSKHDSSIRDNVIFKPCDEIDQDFVSKLDLVIFALELGVEKSINASSGLLWAEKEKMNNSKLRLPLFIVKMGKHQWLEKSRWGYENGYKLFDFFFSQEIDFATQFKKEIKDPLRKIHYSNMGVFKSIPSKTDVSPFVLNKYNLIYIGRMRQSPSRMPFMIEMMDKLGTQFNLNILPGTFSKPDGLVDRLNDNGQNKFGAQTEENYQWLVNYFKVCPQIIIHKPVEWGQHWNYLQHSHLGIDFSPHWSNSKYPAGNAKLLEYMAAGLPSITEKSVGNSELVTQANGGIIVEKTGDLGLYCVAIKKALSIKFDSDKISKITINNNSWERRAIEMIDIMGLKK